MRKYYLPSVLFLAAGVVCAFLRNIIVTRGFDEKNLPIKGFWAITAVNILIVIMVVAAIAIAVRVTKEYEVSSRYGTAFASKSFVLMIAKIVCTVGFICGASLVVIDMLDDVNTRLKTVQLVAFSATAIFGAIGFDMQAISAYTGKHSPADAYIGAFAAFSLALRIIMIYFVNTTNPVIISYSFDCVALSASCLFVFLAAGWFTGKKQTTFVIICGLVASLFCFSALTGKTVSLGDKMICVSMGLYSAICTVSFFKNLKRIRRVF